MRAKGAITRLTLVALLGLSAAAATGCENEADPQTWVKKLDDTSKRPGALRRLNEMWRSKLAAANDNRQAPEVRTFLDAALPAVARAFLEHRDEIATRREAIVILTDSRDPRAVPALLTALEFSPGNGDSERVALSAAQALKDMDLAQHPQKAQIVTRLRATIDRASGTTGNAPRIREACIQALGRIGDRSVVEDLVRVLKRPIDQQEILSARAAADALGELGDSSQNVVDALVYGLYLNVRRANAFNNCLRALVRLGADASVPRLMATVEGQNLEVQALLQSYASVPGMPPVPDGMRESTAIDVLRNFADPRAVELLLGLLRNAQTTPNVRGAAAEALAYTGLALPATDARKGQIFDAIAQVFRGGTPGGEDDMAPAVAPALVLLGDPRAVGLITQRLASQQLRAANTAAFRIGLLMPLASAVRRDSFAQFDREAARTAADLEALLRESPDSQREIGQVQRQLETIRSVASVARECEDGDLACYTGKLGDRESAVVRKAAYMIAWTAGANAAAARTALLAKADHPDPLVRRSIHTALDSLSPSGCPECVTRLEAVIAAERGQESKSLMHLEAQMLMARMRSRS